MKHKRRDTKLQAEGAEFLVLGNLLLEGISSYKAYVNFPGYDLVAVNPETSRTAKIQVKSRYASDYDLKFPVSSFDCDFIVHVALNRGYCYGKRSNAESGVKEPSFYVFPTAVVRQAGRTDDSWGKVCIRDIPHREMYRNNWALIAEFLKVVPCTASRTQPDLLSC